MAFFLGWTYFVLISFPLYIETCRQACLERQNKIRWCLYIPSYNSKSSIYWRIFNKENYFVVHSLSETFKIGKQYLIWEGISSREIADCRQIWSETFWKVVNSCRKNLIFKNVRRDNIRIIRIHFTSRFVGWSSRFWIVKLLEKVFCWRKLGGMKLLAYLEH